MCETHTFNKTWVSEHSFNPWVMRKRIITNSSYVTWPANWFVLFLSGWRCSTLRDCLASIFHYGQCPQTFSTGSPWSARSVFTSTSFISVHLYFGITAEVRQLLWLGMNQFNSPCLRRTSEQRRATELSAWGWNRQDPKTAMKSAENNNNDGIFRRSWCAISLLCQCFLISVPQTCGRESSRAGQSCHGGRPQRRRRERKSRWWGILGVYFRRVQPFTAHIPT